MYNLTFNKNDGIIPFYYEVKEGKKWVVDFCKDFFLTFIYQYIAFKTGNKIYVDSEDKSNFENVKKIARKENLEYLIGSIEGVEHAVSDGHVDILWEMVRTAPKALAARREEYIVQLIDEFQFLNSQIYRDKECHNLIDDLAAGYLSTAESKIAPLIVSGSWVGWLMNQLVMVLPARFKFKYLQDLPEDEAIEMIFKYSQFFEVPITEETAHLIFQLTQGSPFYISSLFRSDCEEKDLTTLEGLQKVVEFETLSDEGEIKSTWMEYMTTAFSKVNNLNAKNIVLYLCKHKAREITRAELLDKLDLNMTDSDLEEKLKALVKADIIKQGASNNRYQGVYDNMFDKVFRGIYQEEIEEFKLVEHR